MDLTKEILELNGTYDEYALNVLIHCPLVNRDIDCTIERPGDHWDGEIDEYSVKCINSISKTKPSDISLIENALYKHYLLIHSLTSDEIPPTKHNVLNTNSGYEFKYIIIPRSNEYSEIIYVIQTDIWWDCEHGICCVFIDGDFRGLADYQDDFIRDKELEFPIQ